MRIYTYEYVQIDREIDSSTHVNTSIRTYADIRLQPPRHTHLRQDPGLFLLHTGRRTRRSCCCHSCVFTTGRGGLRAGVTPGTARLSLAAVAPGEKRLGGGNRRAACVGPMRSCCVLLRRLTRRSIVARALCGRALSGGGAGRGMGGDGSRALDRCCCGALVESQRNLYA